MAKPAIQDAIVGDDDHNALKSSGNTTYVQADSTCFRDLVQRITGPSSPEQVKSPKPKPTTKLHERRRHRIKPEIEISKPVGFPFQPACFMQSSPPLFYRSGYGSNTGWSYPLSPSSVIMKTLSLSYGLPQSPIITPVSHKRSSPQTPVELNRGEEERAIKEKRFYLHPLPRSKQRISDEPELLTLFPPTDTKEA